MNVATRYRIHGDSATGIAGSVETAIRRGMARPGDPLPTIRGLAEELEVSPTTVAAAYRTLRLRGLVSARGRSGTRVADRPPLAARLAPPIRPGVRNLADGNPDPRLLPTLRSTVRRIDPPPTLYEERPNLEELLDRGAAAFEEDGIPSEDVAVVGGAMDGVERVLQAHLAPGDRIAVEDPGYPAVLDLLGALGLSTEAVAVDDAGPRPEALERALRSGARAVVVTPRAQNPMGSAVDRVRARDLRRLLDRAGDVLVIEDDHAGPVAGAPVSTLVGRGRSRWAVVRSVGKSLGPDLRLALVTGDRVTVSRVEGRQRLGTGWVSRVLQQIVVDLWTDPRTEPLLERAAVTYADRRDALIVALAARGIAAHGRSGMNVWVPVPQEAPVIRFLLDAGWAVAGGERFRLRAGPAIRITTATLRSDDAERLAGEVARSLSASTRTVYA
jgi:DNA-binding transcriptional MocR family regulator